MATPNTLFALINVSDTSVMKAKLQGIAPWVSYELQEGQWLIIAPSSTTAKEISDKLDLSAGLAAQTGLVVRIENYFGRNYQTVWDWISAKQGAELVPANT